MTPRSGRGKDCTWNPVTGCTKVSSGCLHCYAERYAARLQSNGNGRYEHGFEVTLQPDLLTAPLHWKAPRTVFTCSMADLFHERVPAEYIQSVFDTIVKADWHLFQVLTKRAQRLADLAPRLPWPPNVWMGVTVERQDLAWRADILRRVPAALRWLCCEPLLGPLRLNLDGIGWVVAGGETGPGARPMELEWARDLRDQCLAAHVPFYLKQIGTGFTGKPDPSSDWRFWRQKPNVILPEGSPKGQRRRNARNVDDSPMLPGLDDL